MELKMIKLLLFVFSICLAIILGPLLADSQGFVHIATNSTIIELSLTTASVLYVCSVIVITLICSVSKKIIAMPKGTINAFKLRAKKKKLTLEDQAIINFEQGEYEVALGLLKHTSNLKNMSERSLLIAAQSAFNIGLYDYTRQALDEAQSRSKQAKLAADVIRAKLNYNIGNSKVALEYLDGTNGSIKNKSVYKLYLDCYLMNHDYEKVVSISKELLKFGVVTPEQNQKYFLSYVESKLREAKSVDDVELVFKKLSKADRKQTKILGAFIFEFLKFGNVNRARELSLDLLKDNLDPVFLNSIANWEIAIPDVLVALKKYANKNIITTQVNLPLLKAMANLEYKSGLLQDALADYKQALSIEIDPQVCLRIGVILTTLQQYAEATEYYSKANALYNDIKALSLKN